MERVRDILLYFVAALAMFSLLCAVYQAMNNMLRSAGLLATIFLVATLIVFIPQLEVLKAWGVEAKLRHSLDRAEEIIGRLRDLSTISARATYLTIAWGNRIGSPSAKEKQRLLDGVNQQLVALNVDHAKMLEISRPLVRLIGVDLFQIYKGSIGRYIEYKSQKIIGSDPQARVKWTADVNDWRKTLPSLADDLNDYDLRDSLSRAIPAGAFTAEEKAQAEKFAMEILRVFEACKAKGGYTDEAAAYYDDYHDLSGMDKKAREFFGHSLGDL